MSSIVAAVVVAPAALIASLNKPKPTSDYLTCSDGADWNFGKGDFTLDFWHRFPPISDKQIVDALATKPDQRIFKIDTILP